MNRPSPQQRKDSDQVQDLLLEIGTEEIPAFYMPPALAHIRSFAESFLRNKRLGFAALSTMGTPRRMALIVTKIPPKSEAQAEEIFGPSIKAAKDGQGQWTQAAKGFANSHGFSPDDLQVRATPKGEYVCVVKKHEGLKAETVLKELTTELIPSIPFPKKMIWNETRFKFARPIRNLVLLFGAKVLPFQIAGVKSGNKTFGLSHEAAPNINVSSHNYVTAMKNHCVLVDPETRKKTILHFTEQLGSRIKGRVKMDEQLLEEIGWLVEHPVGVLGSFDEGFLQLPHEVLMTCMKKHQKFFSVLDEKGKLMPHFIAVRNGISEHQEIVRKGYEKVLNARLVDAKFFFEEDLKRPLEGYVEKCARVTIQEKLGSLGDKIERMKKLGSWLSEGTNLDDSGRQLVQRAITLSKFDLTTNMVYEFPELQGIVGEIYALQYKEDPKVAQAIRQHYYPLTNQGELPEGHVSSIVALTDKLDSLCGNFLIGLTPTGSGDPYGLRRQSTGILRIILQNNWPLSIRELIQNSLQQFASAATLKNDKNPQEKADRYLKELLNFMTERFQLLMQDLGFEPDEIASAAKNAHDPDAQNLVITRLKDKISAIHTLRTHPDFEAIATAFKRAANILKQARSKSVPCDSKLFNSSLLKEESEKELHLAIEKLSGRIQSSIQEQQYGNALKELVGIRSVLDLFFEKVLVMDPDPALSQNRLALLDTLENHFKLLADFSLIQNRRTAG